MYRALSLLFVGSLLAGCAGMDGKTSIVMDTASRPPPLPVAQAPAQPPVKAPKIKMIKREAAPLPAPRPTVQAPPVKEEPPHKWYDHLKFWKN